MSIPATSLSAFQWHALPNEMKLAIVDNLDSIDVNTLSRVDHRTYEICVPRTFKVFISLSIRYIAPEIDLRSYPQSVKLNSYAKLDCFLDTIPRTYCCHIHDLDLSIGDETNEVTRAQTEAVISLLIACPRLNTLALRMAGSLDKSVITSFAYLPQLKQLTMSNIADENLLPLSVSFILVIIKLKLTRNS